MEPDPQKPESHQVQQDNVSALPISDIDPAQTGQSQDRTQSRSYKIRKRTKEWWNYTWNAEWLKRARGPMELLTLGIILVSYFQYRLMNRQTDAMVNQTKFMGTQTSLMGKQIALDRPWVSASFANSIPSINGSTVSMAYAYTLKNSGRSPALSVLVSSGFAFIGPNETVLQVASDAKCGPFEGKGIAIFPGDSHEFKPAVALVKNIPQPHPKGDMLLVVSTCIDYQTPFSGEHYQTLYTSIVGGTSSVVAITNDGGKADLLIREKPQLIPRYVFAK